MTYLSKSSFVLAWLCPKAAWLKHNKPEEFLPDENAKRHMEEGRLVGELARGLFGPYRNVTAIGDDGKLDLDQMIEATRTSMANNTPVICEASFSADSCFCSVDILRREKDGWGIYEVKSTTDPSDEKYIVDVAFQKFVLEQCGIRISTACIISLNNQYVLNGDLDIAALFNITDVTETVDKYMDQIPSVVNDAIAVLSNNEEPPIELSKNCNDCDCWAYCSRNLPKPNVFDLYRLNFDKKVDLYHDGFISFDQLNGNPIIKNATQKRQIDFELNDRKPWIDKGKIREFLDKLSYPMYFLDFESMEPAIPFCQGTKPFSQIVFQYSLHYIETEYGQLYHKEFLAESGTDPRRSVAEALCRDIPTDVCVMAYFKAFECGRLRELAKAYPDLAEHLNNIADHVVDLLEPFQKGYYYNKAMGGSFSIKSVLPALYPDDPSLDYHNLDGIHNGGEAMSVFPKIQYMEPSEQSLARKNLLKYCELDTYAMVKVWEKLVEAVYSD